MKQTGKKLLMKLKRGEPGSKTGEVGVIFTAEFNEIDGEFFLNPKQKES